MAIAQAVLTRLVDETLPEGLPVALRTFKAGSGSCETVLAVPFGPLERAAMDRVIAEPAHQPQDADAPGGHAPRRRRRPGRPARAQVVVFVTDGKETCKGDPAAEVERLVELGVDVTINIVGFALEDPALKADMESWAAAGGGVFFDAQDQESLLAGIAAALRAPFRVYDRRRRARRLRRRRRPRPSSCPPAPTGSRSSASRPPRSRRSMSPGTGVVLTVPPETLGT